MNEETKKAFKFLSERNPTEFEQSRYTYFLMDFVKHQGEEVLLKLAGFYLYIIDSNKDVEVKNRMLESTFLHDLCGAKNIHMLPKSDGYLKYWKQENIKSITT